jgi:hypothetical protein
VCIFLRHYKIERVSVKDQNMLKKLNLLFAVLCCVIFAGCCADKSYNVVLLGDVHYDHMKYHDMSKAEIEAVKDKKFVDLVLSIVSNLYRGNAAYSPDTAEYKIMMGCIRKIEKLHSLVRFDIGKVLEGYTLTEFIEPLLYNSEIDDDNVTLEVDFT